MCHVVCWLLLSSRVVLCCCQVVTSARQRHDSHDDEDWRRHHQNTHLCWASHRYCLQDVHAVPRQLLRLDTPPPSFKPRPRPPIVCMLCLCFYRVVRFRYSDRRQSQTLGARSQLVTITRLWHSSRSENQGKHVDGPLHTDRLDDPLPRLLYSSYFYAILIHYKVSSVMTQWPANYRVAWTHRMCCLVPEVARFVFPLPLFYSSVSSVFVLIFFELCLVKIFSFVSLRKKNLFLFKI